MRIKNVLNFSGHLLSQEVMNTLINKGCEVETVSVGVDLTASMGDQISKLVDSIKSIPVDGTVPFAITIPGLSEITAFLLAELHGRVGYFPMILQIRRSELGTFAISDLDFSENIEPGIADLEKVRLKARGKRFRRNKK